MAGNLGLNTQYHASARSRRCCSPGTLPARARAQLIEAYYEKGTAVSVAHAQGAGRADTRRSCRRYPLNDAYARATLAEIVGADRLAAAQRFAATQLRSGVFLSQPDGTYRFEPLPRLAQIAPFQGVVAGRL